MAKSKEKKEAQEQLKAKRASRLWPLHLEEKFVTASKEIARSTGMTIKQSTEEALSFYYLEKYHEITKLLDSLKYNSEEIQNGEGYQLWKSKLIVLQAAYKVYADNVDDIVDAMKSARKNKGSFILQTSIEGNDQ